jgi:tight adherence protein B
VIASIVASAAGSAGQTLLLVVGIVAMFGALFVGAAMLFAPGENKTLSFTRLRDALRRRPQHPTRSLKSIAEQAGGLAERSLDWSGRRGGVETALERAGVNMRAGEFLVLAVAAMFAAFALGALVGGFLVAVIFGAFAGIAFRIALSVLAERRTARFDAQLETTLPLMAGSLRAGFGIMQALDAVARESEAPTSDEFRRIVMESRLGRDLTDSLTATSARMHSEDFDFVVQAIDIHRQVGGDLAEVLDKVGGTIRDRNRVRRQVQSLSAEGRLSAGILFALPFVMFIVIQIINPSYLHELTGNSIGRILLGVGLGLMVVGGLWMRRMIRLVF